MDKYLGDPGNESSSSLMESFSVSRYISGKKVNKTYRRRKELSKWWASSQQQSTAISVKRSNQELSNSTYTGNRNIINKNAHNLAAYGFKKKNQFNWLVGFRQKESLCCIFVMDVTREFQMKSPGFGGLFLGQENIGA